MLVPDYPELNKALTNGAYAEAIHGFAAQLKNRRAMPVLPDLDVVLNPAASALEVVESWKGFLTEWMGQPIPFLAWTTPEGWELVEQILPGDGRPVTRIQFPPIEEVTVQHLVRVKLAEMERGGRFEFAPDFCDAIMAHRHRWQPGFNLVDPGRSLRLIDAVVMRALIQTWETLLKRTDQASSGEHRVLSDEFQRGLVLEEIANAVRLYTDLDDLKPSHSLGGHLLPPLTITTGMLDEFLSLK